MKYIATFVVLLFSINFLYPNNIYDKKYDIILDTDANNELDDQHAIAYMLFNQKFFNILGITVNETFGGNKLKYHVLEAQRIVDLCGYNNKIRVIPGASKNYELIKNKITRKKFDGHKAVNFIIENANQVKNEKLIIVAIGKLTNVALALKKDPEIAKKIKLIWLGSNFPKKGEYNLINDPGSLKPIIQNQNLEFEIVTVRYGEKTGSDYVKVNVDEIKEFMNNFKRKIKVPIEGRHGGEFYSFGQYSLNLFINYGYKERPLFDLCALSIIKNPSFAEKKVIEKVDFDGTNWNFNGLKNRKIVFWENFSKELILEDFFNSFN